MEHGIRQNYENRDVLFEKLDILPFLEPTFCGQFVVLQLMEIIFTIVIFKNNLK